MSIEFEFDEKNTKSVYLKPIQLQLLLRISAGLFPGSPWIPATWDPQIPATK